MFFDDTKTLNAFFSEYIFMRKCIPPKPKDWVSLYMLFVFQISFEWISNYINIFYSSVKHRIFGSEPRQWFICTNTHYFFFFIFWGIDGANVIAYVDIHNNLYIFHAPCYTRMRYNYIVWFWFRGERITFSS